VTKKIDPDAFVPYRAMNYFDRFLSRCDMTVTENSSGYILLSFIFFELFCVETENSLVFIRMWKVGLIPKKLI
jgi:hypothetical protein